MDKIYSNVFIFRSTAF